MTGTRHLVLAALVVAGGAVISTCGENGSPTAPTAASNIPILASTTPLPSVTLVGAGNIARCDRTANAQATAALLTSVTGTVFVAGDGAYVPSGWQTCFNSTWGAQKARTLPLLGNKDYDSSSTASAYFAYWGTQAGDPTKGYYSLDLGAWHVIVLNSNNSFVSTAVGSPQELWLKADLAATTKQCKIALFHAPRFYSTTTATFSPTGTVKPFWDDLYAAHADVIVNAHMRDYERFAPQNSAGVADSMGIREFIIGTGGEGLDGANTLIIPNSQVNISGTYGVLKLTLADGSYSWQFVPAQTPAQTDAGTATCHGAPASGPVTPSVNSGPDLLAHPGDTVTVSTTFSDAVASDAPWSYMIAWGDGGSTTGTAQSQTSPIVAKHVYMSVGLDSVRVVVTNSAGLSGRDSVGVQIQAPVTSNVLVGAGDIADCTGSGDSITASLLDGIPGTVFLAGDNAYPNGAPSDYANCYAPTWGRHISRTRPAPGNHDYQTSGASGYFGYFGPAAGDPAKGYYSYDLGDWHIVALNSNIAHTAGTPQEQWLRADLAASPKRCTLAYWHHPLFTSGPLADTSTRALWQALYDYGAEVVVVGHEHYYERFAPQTAAGVADPANGIREFVAGTGGSGLFSQATTHPANWETGNDNTFGVLKFTLTSTGYSWQFVHAPGKTYADSGSGSCHDAPGATNSPPTAVPGGPYTGVEGAAVTFSGSGSSDPNGDAITYAWNFGDSSTGTGVAPTHTYADNGTYTVSLTVTDSKGAASTAVTTTATISNAPPVVTLPSNQAATSGTAYSLSATFSDAGVNDSPWSYSIDWGDGSPQTTGSATSQASPISASHTYAAGGTDTVRVTVTDKDGGAGTAKTPVAVTTANRPPTAAPGGPYTGTEGTAVAFNGGGSSDPDGDAITYAWSFGDGTTGTGATPSHTYADNGTYTASLTVTDSKGAASAAVTTTATIANANPVVTLPANQVATAGVAYNLSATFSDAGVNDTPWGYSIDWGDGSTPTTGSATSQSTAIAASHTYAAGGTDTVRVTVTDKDGGAGTGKTPVVVAAVNHPPTAAPGGPYTGTEGAAVALNGSGSSDPDGDAITYAWSFGDGATGTGATPSHTYADNGTYTVSLTVTDSKGAPSAAVTTTATIANANPAVTLPANQVATAAIAYSLSATFSDAGVNDSPWAYAIDWGDGSAVTTGSATSQSAAITASHTYAAGGTDTVRVTVTDKDGGAGAAKTPVTVAAANRPPTAVAGGPYSGNEGAAVVLNGTGSSDPDGDAITYAWSFGDGTTGTGATPSHAYADNGTYAVSLTVTDSKGAPSTPAAATVTVANVAPIVSAPASLTANAGTPVTLSATFSDPGTRDAPWAYSINWGDGSAATAGSVTTQTAISAAHTYAAAGSNTAIVTVTDKDGGAGSGQTLLTVSQQVASVTLVGAGNIAKCTNTNSQATAALISSVGGAVFSLGDNAYPNGTAANYQNCYGPTWGQFLANTYPVVGHHEYDSSTTAAGYFGYFGAVAGNPGQGYYSFDLGAWHIVVLNSNNTYVSTAVGSPQETWLKADLAASTKKCQLALFHHPRFYSTTSTAFYPTSTVKPFWDDLYAAGAELILNAHMQDYERFAPQNSAGTADPNGIREIIVGTGGGGLDSPNTLIIPNSEARISSVYGVLKLTLSDGSYSWQFIPVAGQTASDSGSGTCH
ncbi:MAG TPA: PKD domain-containing protein [Gemmatimonadales bacterium]|nr:PKD domain-containing protein [Gemmatimonadales bacterium]